MVTKGICQMRILKDSIPGRGFANRKKEICTGCVFFKIEEYFHVVECSVER